MTGFERRTLLLVAALAGALVGAAGSEPARAGSCAAVCERPEDVRACSEGRPVWGLRESADACRPGGFGYLESRGTAEAELRRLARFHKRRCDEDGDCGRFEALDRAEIVCLACDPNAVPPVSAAADDEAGRGTPPPCKDDEWLQMGEPGHPSRCFPEFVGLSPRIALQGKCTEGDCRSGVGTVTWPGGASYVGAFRKGRRHGQGTFTWPDGRQYVGQWREGQPTGLGTRIYADGRYRAGYFERGRYLGPDVDHLETLESRVEKADKERAAAPRPSCEEVCTEDAEIRLGRINDEYECCFARHAFCAQKAEVFLERCKTRVCAEEARLKREDCDLRYACDAVQKEKLVRFRKNRSECVETCTSAGLDGLGLRISERGTLYDD